MGRRLHFFCKAGFFNGYDESMTGGEAEEGGEKKRYGKVILGPVLNYRLPYKRYHPFFHFLHIQIISF